ncbi:D-glycero-alpha-D-manno-heptose-1,7-bisphosphate 7-phosphatase [Arthrobacter sp. NPDC058192]|uniref:D-glycero-alpha-D-manno-heptose-1,7-bisphosphate 7-phosphatase n=1 Tax=Arthrobacter sp. NPDC058192 TaxID=3346372 RepID=UPI0036ECAA61
MESPRRLPLLAALFDRDGTLVCDVPYNGDPDLVRAMPHAGDVLRRLRCLGLRTGVLTNQSGVSRGLLTPAQVDAVNGRVEELLGPFDLWEVCFHGPEDSCLCRKPAPGMILTACRRLGVEPSQTAYVGDIGTDVEAAARAGSWGILVPTAVTFEDEIAAAATVAPDLEGALELIVAAIGQEDQR